MSSGESEVRGSTRKGLEDRVMELEIEIHVLNNPWGGTWDLGRNGKTDLHAYNNSGVLQYTLQALNFEGNAAFDPGTDGAYLYGGQDVFSGSGGGGYVGNINWLLALS
jgi:hypothetical protein